MPVTSFVGKAKFDLENHVEARVVTEEDGTEIEEDEVLQEIGTGTILILLKTGETWKPPQLLSTKVYMMLLNYILPSQNKSTMH